MPMRMFRSRENLYIESFEETATLLTPVEERPNTCLRSLRDEFRLRNLRLRWPTPLVFYRPQWRWPLLVFTLYRVTLTCYVTAWLVYSVISGPKINGFYWPMFLTSWAYAALMFHLWAATALTVRHAIAHRYFLCEAPPLHRSMGAPAANGGATPSLDAPELDGQEDVGFIMPTDRLPRLCKLSWFLFNVVANGGLIVSVVYFAALYPQLYHHGQFPSFMDFSLHGINAIIILLELCLSALPVRLVHCVFTHMFGVCYIVMSVLLYYFYSDKPIYPEVLDWSAPGRTAGIVCGLMLIAVPLVQLLLFCIYKIRVYVFRGIYDCD